MSIDLGKALSITLLAACLLAPEMGAASELQLDKSVLLLRHGVRSPNQTPEQLAPSSTRPWPEWSVGAGQLTERGAALIGRLGVYYRQRYVQEGLLSKEACPAAGQVASWADNAHARVILSDQALLDGLFPGCGLKAAYAPLTGVDPLFNPSAAGTCPIESRRAQAAVLRMAGGDLERVASSVRPDMKRLQEILKVRNTSGCATDGPSCGMDGLINVLQDGPEGPKLVGGITQAATLSENFLLEYMDGKPANEIAWGEASTPEALAALVGPRNLFVKLLRKPPYLAARHTTPLARAVLAALVGDMPPPVVAGTASPNATRLVVFMGRDNHLAGISGLLGIDWSLPGQPDLQPPGATLAFERLRNPKDDQQYVRVKLYYQTLVQMRDNTVLDLAHPPAEVLLKVPGCAKDEIEGACPLSIVRARFEDRFATDCPQEPKK